MKKFLLFSFSVVIAILVAFRPVWQSADNRMLQPGDEINGMVITTGGEQAPALWPFCSAAQENEGVMTVDCHVPLLSKLAIGYPFEGADRALQTLDWSALSWELIIDGQAVDLEAFGLYDYVIPDLAPHPSPIREIFRQIKTWDIVLINPTPGIHTLHGTASTGTDTYTWAVHFAIEPSSGP